VTGAAALMGRAEQAVLAWLADNGCAPGGALRPAVVDGSALFPAGATTGDPEVEVERLGDSRFFSVLARDGDQVALRGRFTAVLLPDAAHGANGGPPAGLESLVLDDLEGLGTAVGSHDPATEAETLRQNAQQGTGGPEQIFAAPSEPMSFGGYVDRLLEMAAAAVAGEGPRPDLLVRRLRVRLLADARRGEQIHACYQIAGVRGGNHDGRFDAHVVRGEDYVPTATGIVLHGVGTM
jgi:hypothetical protein